MFKQVQLARQLTVLLLFLTFSFQILFSQEKEKAEKLRKIISEYGQAEVIVPFTGKVATGYLGKYVSIAAVDDNNIHVILSVHTIEWFFRQNYSYNIIERIPSKGIINSANLNQAMEWNSYPSYSQYDSIMQSFARKYPGLCRLDTIGMSINGKVVFAMKVSDNAAEEEDEPQVFYTSSIHGDETGGFILMLRLIDHLLKNYTVNGRVQHLVNSLEIWINPLANPDGTYRNGNLIINPVRWNASGVDLNRNFPDPDEPGIVQEKETSDMIRFMRKHRFILSANFHSGAQVVNYPWDRWPQLHADDAWFRMISRKYADTAHSYSVPTYMRDLDNGVTRGISWYKINGGRQDFVTYELHGREVTIELDDAYITPPNELGNLWDYNRNSLLGYLENAFYGIHGNVTDVRTLRPVAARIFIAGHDADNSHIFTDSLTGSFVRMLAPGEWDIAITAKGYRDTILRNIVLGRDHTIDLAVMMTPSESGVPLIYPNPARSVIKIVLPPQITGEVNLKVFSPSGSMISDYNTVASAGIPLIYDAGRLATGVYGIQITHKFSGSVIRNKFVVIRN
jgi:hypothetical protein